jgi:hypothetical protein
VTRTAIALIGQRRQALASVGTRLALGAYPLAFVVVFGWAYGKDAFDLAAAAGNWAAYLNVFVLAGFALVPPAVARLRGDAGRMAADRAIVRNHIALARWLLLAAVATALGLAVTIDGAFPELAARGGARLQSWYACFALLALTQVPATLWLGVVQAAGRYAVGLAAIALPRLLAVLAVPACKAAGASASWSIGAVTAIVLVGQVWLAAAGRRALCAIDPQLLRERGDAAAVLWPNISGGTVTLVGAMVSIVPVTIVGYLHPADVGLAHVAVGVSNAVGAVFVAAFFPASLALAQGVPSRSALWRHSLGLARRIAAGTAAALALMWLTQPVCAARVALCDAGVYMLLSAVLLGAGLRLAALGPYHGGLAVGRPHLALMSACVEALVVIGTMLALAPGWGLPALGLAFLVGGGARALVALTLELRWLAEPGAEHAARS